MSNLLSPLDDRICKNSTRYFPNLFVNEVIQVGGLISPFSGCSFVNTTTNLLNPIPTAITKIPILSGTKQLNWTQDWDYDPIVANHRLIYNGTINKKFSVRFDLNITHSGGTSHTIFVQVNSNGVPSNNIKAQSIVGAVGGFIYSSEALVIMTPGQFVELNIYSNTSGPILNTSSNLFVSGLQPVYPVSITIQEITCV